MKQTGRPGADDGSKADAREGLAASLRALVAGLDAGDLDDLDGAREGAAASRRPAVVALAATLARSRSLAGSESQALRLDARRTLAFVERLLAERSEALARPAAASARQLTDRERAIRAVYRWTAGRTPGEAEVAEWSEALALDSNYPNFLIGMADSEEARSNGVDPDRRLSDGAFVQAMHRLVLQEAPAAAAIEDARSRLRAGLSREAFAIGLLRRRLAAGPAPEAPPASPRVEAMSRAEWESRRERLRDAGFTAPKPLPPAPPAEATAVPPVVTAIVHAGPAETDVAGAVAGLLADPWFMAHGELIIVDDAAPDERSAEFAALAADRRNLYHWRLDAEIGRAGALNLAVGQARGRYVLRLDGGLVPRPGALARQAEALDGLGFVDVVHQGSLVAYDPDAGFDEAEAIGASRVAPIVTVHTLLQGDPLSEAPMWRRSLHDALGLFDEACGAEAELDFWLRCLGAGKCFYKLNEPFGVRLAGEPIRAAGAGDAVERRAAAMPAAVLDDLDDFRRALGGRPSPEDGATSRYRLAQRRLREVAAACNPSRVRRPAGEVG